jgi:hypothetical protein
MSRTNKTRGYGRKGKHLQWAKQEGNQRVRHQVHERLKDIPFTDAFDEKALPEKNIEIFDRWYYD